MLAEEKKLAIVEKNNKSQKIETTQLLLRPNPVQLNPCGHIAFGTDTF